MLLNKGKKIIENLRRQGLKFAVVGGIYKKKEEIHDIDLVIKEKDLSFASKILSKGNIDTPVELYIANDKNYHKLIKALRATTYESIQGHLMRGLRFKKIRFE